jgi:sugar/nucleoside kinase (ribokinase family)
MARRWDLTAIGDVNVDLIMARPEREPAIGQEILVEDLYLTFGGATALIAADAARLGLAVRMVGRVGADHLGAMIVGELAEAGVDTSLVLPDPALHTGITVSLTWPRDRAFITYPGPIAALRVEDIPAEVLTDTRHLHVSSFFLQRALQPGLAGLFRRAHSAGLTTSLDTGDDPAGLWDSGLAEVLGEADLFFPNRREATQIAGVEDAVEALDRLHERIPTVAVKLGGEGAIVATEGARLRVTPLPVQAVDTTGAGDAFNAGYLAGYLRGRPPAECLLQAAASGALSTTWLGGYSAEMTPAALERLIASAGESAMVRPL